jgi:hypothetical protein
MLTRPEAFQPRHNPSVLVPLKPARCRLAPAVLAAALLLGGCGSEGDGTSASAPQDRPRTGETSAPEATVEPSHCPTDRPDCRTTEGRIVYVERVDPDGDGDAHFVVLDPQGITLPRLTAIDVRKGLRPHPLPGVGELISAAGPVQTGSLGQSQIHALELHVAGR